MDVPRGASPAISLLHALNALLLTALVAASLYVYPDLPAGMPLHFGADGEATRWGDRTLLSWMTLPLIAVAIVLLMYGVGALMPRRPQSFNIPDKDKLLQLPQALQHWVIGGAVNMLHALTLTMLVTFCGIQYGTWEAAHTGTGSPMIVASLLFSLVVTPFITIALLIVSQRRIDRAWRAHQAAQEGAT